MRFLKFRGARSENDTMAEEKPDPKQLVELSRVRILLVEDSQIDRDVALASLRKLGATSVQVAETGSLALGKIQNALEIRKPFDLILLDAKMPGQDGIAVLKSLRSQLKTKSTPVIMITASAHSDEVSEFIGMGISGYIVKPFQLEVLKTKLLEAIAVLKKSSKQAS